MKLLLIGRGRMGTLIADTARREGDEVLAALGKGELKQMYQFAPDVVIDFSRPETLPELCAYVQATGTPLLSGTTGYSAAEKSALESLGAFAPVLWSANFSLGIAVLSRAVHMASEILSPNFDIEITETHHNQKADAPSGTAKLLAFAVDAGQALTPVYGREGNCGKRKKQEIGIHALRGGTVAGTHTVYFLGPDEELEFTHRAASRQIFASGALHMAHLLPGRPKGVYDLQEILFGER